jgi:hypothetical protein
MRVVSLADSGDIYRCMYRRRIIYFSFSAVDGDDGVMVGMEAIRTNLIASPIGLVKVRGIPVIPRRVSPTTIIGRVVVVVSIIGIDRTREIRVVARRKVRRTT